MPKPLPNFYNLPSHSPSPHNLIALHDHARLQSNEATKTRTKRNDGGQKALIAIHDRICDQLVVATAQLAPMSLIGTKQECHRRLATSVIGGITDIADVAADFRS